MTCGSVVSGVSHVTPRALRAGARVPARGAHTGPPDKPTNTPHGAYQLGEGQALSSLAFERSEALPLCSVQSHHTRRARCAPVRRATATVARLTPCDSVACAIVSIRARGKRKPGSDLLHHGNASGAGICDQACGPPSPPRSRASVRQAPRCRATDVNLDGERRATTCLVADARTTAPAVPW